MYSRRCYITGCATGTKGEVESMLKAGRKEIHKFRVPRDPVRQKAWRDAIPIHKRTFFKRYDVVCSLHFKEEELVKYFETPLSNGTIHMLPRERVTLKKFSIPSLNLVSIRLKSGIPTLTSDSEPDIPTLNLHDIKTESDMDTSNTFTSMDATQQDYLTPALKIYSQPSLQQVLQFFKENNIDENKTRESIEHSSANSSALSINRADLNMEESCFRPGLSFSTLSQGLKSVKKPNSWWTLNYLPHSVIYVKWNAEFEAERRLVIDENLKARVYLKHQEILSKLDVDVSINSVEDVNNLLIEVDQFKMCTGLDDVLSKKSCLVYVGYNYNTLCLSCKSFKKQNLRKKSKAAARKCKEKIRNRKLSTCQRQNRRLRNRIEDLKDITASLQHQLATAEGTIKKQRRQIFQNEYDKSLE